MALTRKFLKALEIEGDKADQIIEAHTETLDGLKASLDAAQADAGRLPEIQKQLEQMGIRDYRVYIQRMDWILEAEERGAE